MGKQGLCRQSKYGVGMMSIPWLPRCVYRGRRAKCKITRRPCEEMMTVIVNSRGRDCCTVPHASHSVFLTVHSNTSMLSTLILWFNFNSSLPYSLTVHSNISMPTELTVHFNSCLMNILTDHSLSFFFHSLKELSRQNKTA